MCLQHFYDKGHASYCGLVRGPQRRRVAVSGMSNRLNYCEIFLAYTQFIKVAAGRIIQLGGLPAARGPWPEDP